MIKSIIQDTIKDLFPELPSLISRATPLLGTVLFTELFKKYVFGDFNFVIFLAVVILLDTLSKIYYLVNSGQKFDFDILVKKLSLKILKYFIYISAMHVFLNLEVEGQKFTFGFYIKYIIYSLLITRDISSILKNLGITLPKELQRFFEKEKDESTINELKDLANKSEIQSVDGDNDGESNPPKPPK